MAAYTLPRRELLRLCGAAGAACLLGATSMAENLTPAETAVDHLLPGAADLDLIEWAGDSPHPSRLRATLKTPKGEVALG